MLPRLLLFSVITLMTACGTTEDKKVQNPPASSDMKDMRADFSSDMSDMMMDMPVGNALCDADGTCGLCVDYDFAKIKPTLESHLNVLTHDLPQTPISNDLMEDTNGSLVLSLSSGAFSVVESPGGIFVAASEMDAGRVVAFSGQDFLSSGTRSTLLDEDQVGTLVRNAVEWASGSKPKAQIKVLAANERLSTLLKAGGIDAVDVVTLRKQEGLKKIYNWDAAALANVDVAIIQVNEWGTLLVDAQDIENIRQFIKRGGGVLIATSALHWSWWLSDTSMVNPADMLLEEAGIGWKRHSIKTTTSGQTMTSVESMNNLWCQYVRGDSIEDSKLVLLAPAFAGAQGQTSKAEINVALDRVRAEAPAFPAPRNSGRAQLTGAVAVSLWAHDWSAPHPWAAKFPGLVKTAPEGKQTVTIDTTWKRTRPLGLYAPPGKVVTINIPEAHVQKGLKVRIGEDHDNLQSNAKITSWKRSPLLYASRQVDQKTMKVGTGVGGSIYLQVPEDYEDTSIVLDVEGAVKQAVYIHGKHDEAAFLQDVKTTGAPVVLIGQEGKVRMAVPVFEASKVQSPGEVVEFWNKFYDHHHDLSGELSPRRYASDWLFDIHVGYGYANATSNRINYPLGSVRQALRTEVGDEDWWLFAHELGHQFQTSNWRGGGITEVAVNLFSMFTINYYIHGGGDFDTIGRFEPVNHDDYKGLVWEDAGLFERLHMYRQLIETFGWPVMEAVFDSYYDDLFPVDVYAEHLDGFAIRFSKISGKDISVFLKRWQYPLSPEVEMRIVAMELDVWLPPGW